MKLYVLRGDKIEPFEESELISLWKKGTLKGTDLVRTKKSEEWMPLAKLLSVSSSNPILPRNDESRSEKKQEPNSIKWYERWQTWVAATATAFVLWLVLAHITSHPAPEQMNEASTSLTNPISSPDSSWQELQRDLAKFRAENSNSTSNPTSHSEAKSVSHSAAWQKGYDVGKLHRANGEPLPSLIKLYSMEEIEGAGFYDGYLTGFRDGGN